MIKLTQRHGGREGEKNGWGMVGGGWLGIGTKLFKFLLVFEWWDIPGISNVAMSYQ